MSRRKLTVVLSQAQGKNPAKRALEESITAALLLESGIDVSIVPSLYDMDANHSGRLYLEGIRGDLVFLSWMYPRATFWMLDRAGIKGHYGENRIAKKPEQEQEEDDSGEPVESKGIGAVNVPDRTIYCLDLRDYSDHRVYIEEIKRIAEECAAAKASKTPLLQLGLITPEPSAPAKTFTPEELLAPTGRRWYPVIDYSRCTNCMECLDFCLFGVYGVDSLDRIVVENQDSCKKGCPACSRVCPEHAIMFPEHKTPAIAGAPVAAPSGLKIDLTKLFGGSDALALAAAERDSELVKEGRQAVGLSVGIPKRQASKPQAPKDDLDRLMDELDALEI
ncbi:MAG: ferredoxin family protein [Gemmataceae bacterium]